MSEQPSLLSEGPSNPPSGGLFARLHNHPLLDLYFSSKEKKRAELLKEEAPQKSAEKRVPPRITKHPDILPTRQ